MSKVKPRISIVIPTLNEERFLPKLLASIAKQTFKDYEVIVADAGSKDSTVKLAKEWGARVVKGGMPGPGRNAGARAAKADKIFFLDADVELPDDFLEPALAEIDRKGLECATWGVYANDGDLSYELLFEVLSTAQRVGTRFGARLAGGFAIFCSKRVFEQINGFDETLLLSEDHDFVERAAKVGKYGFLSSVTAGLSARRWQKEGGLKMGLKYIYAMLYTGLFGQIKTEVIKYEFGNYGELDKKKFREKMKEFLDELTDIEKIRDTLMKRKEENELAMKKFQKLLKELLPKQWNK
jgi:glycosyltransferase involved in cell wall biosynthesis